MSYNTYYIDRKELDLPKMVEEDGGVEDMCSSSHVRNPKLQFAAGTAVHRRMLDPTKKTLHAQEQRRSPSKTVSKGQIKFRIKSHTYQRHLGDSNKSCTYQGQRPHRDWSRTVFEVSPADAWVRSGLP